jgi:hypothetical protein
MKYYDAAETRKKRSDWLKNDRDGARSAAGRMSALSPNAECARTPIPDAPLPRLRGEPT